MTVTFVLRHFWYICYLLTSLQTLNPWPPIHLHLPSVHAVDLVHNWSYWRLGDLAGSPADATDAADAAAGEAAGAAAAAGEEVVAVNSSLFLRIGENGTVEREELHRAGGESFGAESSDQALKKKHKTHVAPYLDGGGVSLLREKPFYCKRRWCASTIQVALVGEGLSRRVISEALHVELDFNQWLCYLDPLDNPVWSHIQVVRMSAEDGYSFEYGSTTARVNRHVVGRGDWRVVAGAGLGR